MVKNTVLTIIFILGILVPVAAILAFAPTPQPEDIPAEFKGASVINFPVDYSEPPPPIISYDFSDGAIPSAQFMAIERNTYSDGAVSIHITLPAFLHPEYWANMIRKMPLVPKWLPIMMAPEEPNRHNQNFDYA